MRRRSLLISAALAAAMAQGAMAQETTLTGRVAESFGRQFVIETEEGRVLVVPAPRAELSPAIGEVVTVTGREDGDTLRGADLVGGTPAEDGPAPGGDAQAAGAPDRGPGARAAGAEGGPGAEGPRGPDAPGADLGAGPGAGPEGGAGRGPAPEPPDGRGASLAAPRLDGALPPPGPGPGPGLGGPLALAPGREAPPPLARGDAPPRGPAAFAPPRPGEGPGAGSARGPRAEGHGPGRGPGGGPRGRGPEALPFAEPAAALPPPLAGLALSDLRIDERPRGELRITGRLPDGGWLRAETDREGRLASVQADEGGTLPPALLDAALPPAMARHPEVAALARVREFGARRGGVEVEGLDAEGREVSLRFSRGGQLGEIVVRERPGGLPGLGAEPARARLEALGYREIDRLRSGPNHIDADALNPFGERVTVRLDPMGEVVRERAIRD